MFEKMLINVYGGHGAGADNPLGSKFIYKDIHFCQWSFAASYFPLNDIISVFQI